MPGNPTFHKLSQEIEAAGAAHGVSGEDHIFARLADGEGPKAIATTFGVSRALLYKWRDASDERRAGWAAAMKLSAESRAEDAGDLLEELAEQSITPADVSLAKERASHRRWMASVLDPERFGQQAAQANVTVNIGTLHLDALRQYGRMPAHAEPIAIGSGD